MPLLWYYSMVKIHSLKLPAYCLQFTNSAYFLLKQYKKYTDV